MDGDDYEPFSNASLFEAIRTYQDGEVKVFGERLLQTCAYPRMEKLMHLLNGFFKHAQFPGWRS